MLGSQSSKSEALPQTVKVQSLINSRYPNGKRPLSWDKRVEGIDTVRGEDGETYKLLSDGGQSPPKKGWVILLSTGDNQSGYRWTLYGIVGDPTN